MDFLGIDGFYIILLVGILIAAYIIGSLLKKAVKVVAIGFVVFIILYALGFVSLSWLHIDATKEFFLKYIPQAFAFVVDFFKGILKQVST